MKNIAFGVCSLLVLSHASLIAANSDLNPPELDPVVRVVMWSVVALIVLLFAGTAIAAAQAEDGHKNTLVDHAIAGFEKVQSWRRKRSA